MEVKHTFRLLYSYLKFNISTALEYRTPFILQVTFMTLNDIIWILYWYLLFIKFGTINGYSFKHMLIIYAIILVAHGITRIIFGNSTKLAEVIRDGKLDYYLTLPKNTLYHFLIGRMSVPAIGDLIMGILLLPLAITISQIPLTIFLIILSGISYVSYHIITGSMAFYIKSSNDSAKTLNDSIIVASAMPTSIYEGAAKIIIFTILPAGLIVGLPVELLSNYSTQLLLIYTSATTILLLLALGIYNYGLKKYESGNMIASRI